MIKFNKSSIDFPNPRPCPFAKKAISTRHDAFLTADLEIPYEQQDEVTLPELQIYHSRRTDGTINYYTQGQYHFVDHIVANLKLVCDDYDRRGIEYYLFCDVNYLDSDCEFDYVLWVPNEPHMNSLIKGSPKVEEVA